MQNPNDLSSYDGFCICGVLLKKIIDDITPETIQILIQCKNPTHYCICYMNPLPFNICRSHKHSCVCDTHSSFVSCFAQEDKHECICWNLTSKKKCISTEHECGCCGKYWMKNYSKSLCYLNCQAKNHVCEYKKIGYNVRHNCIAHVHSKIKTLKEVLNYKNIHAPLEIFGHISEFL